MDLGSCKNGASVRDAVKSAIKHYTKDDMVEGQLLQVFTFCSSCRTPSRPVCPGIPGPLLTS